MLMKREEKGELDDQKGIERRERGKRGRGGGRAEREGKTYKAIRKVKSK